MQRYGITVPLTGKSFNEQRDWIIELADLGYTDLWSAEVDNVDAFTPLVLASQWAPSLRLGTAIVPGLHTRAGAHRAVGRERVDGVVGQLRARHRRVVERDRRAVERGAVRAPVPARARHVAIRPHRAHRREGQGGLRDLQHQRLPPDDAFAAAGADSRGGVASRHVAARRARRRRRDHQLAVARRRPHGRALRARRRADKEIVARIFVLLTEDADMARGIGRQMIAAYLNVPVYAAFHEWLGRGEVLGPMWEAWKAGDRKGALATIPDSVVDELIVHGPPEHCREVIERYIENGVTTPGSGDRAVRRSARGVPRPRP